VRLGVEAVRDEALQSTALLVEDADRRVSRSRQLRGDAEEVVEDAIEIEELDERPSGFEQPAEGRLVQCELLVG
jgi:hypothetical protein